MKILHLYPDLMNLYGEYGNVVCLKKHLEDQGFKVKVDETKLNFKNKIEDYDFVYCGSGLEANLKVALKDLMKHSKSLSKAINNGTYMLFTGNAMELLANSIDGEKGLGLVSLDVETKEKRYTGDVVVENKDFGEIVGFINKSTIIKAKDGLFNYVFKDANLNDFSDKEGYRINNLIGTHIIGPILVKNPKLMRFYVEGIAKQNKKKFVYKEVFYPYEEDSYEVTLNALKERIKK